MTENEDMIECEACSAEVDADDAYLTQHNRHVCSDCVRVCEYCETVGDENDDWTTVGHEIWCNDCAMNHAYYCDGCNEYVTDGVVTTNDTGLSYCEDCDGHLYYCEECDEYFDNDTCDYHDNSANVHNYSYRPEPIFHTTSDNERLFFGFELEMEFNDSSILREAAEYASEKLDGSAYLKDDGSLNIGFELVTHPMSFDYLMDEAEDVWQVIETLNKTYSARSYHTDTCGFHIHISRTGFNGGSHMHRFLNLVYSNDYLFSKLAGRKSDRWAKFDDVNVTKRIPVYHPDDPERQIGWDRVVVGRSFKEKLSDHHNDRYSAVNTNNEATLELRIFKGTLSQTALAAHIQLAHAAVEYTRTLSVSDVRNGALQPLAFLDYIASHADIYADLQQRIEHKQVRENAMPTPKPEIDKERVAKAEEYERREMQRMREEHEQWQRRRAAAVASQDEQIQEALRMASERASAYIDMTTEYIGSSSFTGTATFEVRP